MWVTGEAQLQRVRGGFKGDSEKLLSLAPEGRARRNRLNLQQKKKRSRVDVRKVFVIPFRRRRVREVLSSPQDQALRESVK